ncbi:MAG: hypothetical protein FWD28_09645 [Treponema sp.]|nr:hypothetical protein [Treponema sp.]
MSIVKKLLCTIAIISLVFVIFSQVHAISGEGSLRVLIREGSQETSGEISNASLRDLSRSPSRDVNGVTREVSNVSFIDNNYVFRNAPLFPQMLFTDTINSWRYAENLLPYWVNSREEYESNKRTTENQISILLNNDILAYYGHPASRNMGILGRYTIEELDSLLSELAAEYELVSEGRKIQKAFYLIYGTVWPRGDIGIIKHDVLMEYIEYGITNNILIFIDHQIGRFDPLDSLKVMLPYLHYPNIHLALDPEWRTLRPMVEIGHLTAAEVNTAQQIIEDYLIANNLPGERMLVIHQFNHVMIKDRADVRSDFNRVRLVHCADGFGNPHLKRHTYAYNALAANMPIKAFKLFYNLGIPGAGYDEPLMTPKEVYELNPRPRIIMYQ